MRPFLRSLPVLALAFGIGTCLLGCHSNPESNASNTTRPKALEHTTTRTLPPEAMAAATKAAEMEKAKRSTALARK